MPGRRLDPGGGNYPVFPGPALSNLRVEVTGTVIRFVTVADTTRVDDGRSDAGTRTLSVLFCRRCDWRCQVDSHAHCWARGQEGPDLRRHVRCSPRLKQKNKFIDGGPGS